MAGGLWLIVIVTGVFGLTAASRLVVSNNPTVTATNILANEVLFRLSFVANLLAGVCYVGVTVLLYELLKPVGRTLSLLGAFFGLGGVAIGGPSFLSQMAPLIVLQHEPYSGVFTEGQMQALAMIPLDLHTVGFYVTMVLFGLQILIVGYLILRSTFLPRVLGVLLAIGGLTYLITSFASFLSPALGAALSSFIAPRRALGRRVCDPVASHTRRRRFTMGGTGRQPDQVLNLTVAVGVDRVSRQAVRLFAVGGGELAGARAPGWPAGVIDRHGNGHALPVAVSAVVV